MDFTCANCKHRGCWDCEDYNWGYLDTKKCENNFELDINTLDDKTKDYILELAEFINDRDC